MSKQINHTYRVSLLLSFVSLYTIKDKRILLLRVHLHTNYTYVHNKTSTMTDMCQQRTRKKGKTQLTSRTLLWGQTLLDLTSLRRNYKRLQYCSQQEHDSEGRILSRILLLVCVKRFWTSPSFTKFFKRSPCKIFYST